MIGVVLSVGAVLAVELIRDFWHYLSHRWAWLYRHHAWHHRVFRRDLSIPSLKTYQKAQWQNDVPECGVMLVGAIAFWLLCWYGGVPQSAGAAFGVIYTLGFMLAAILRGAGIPGARELTDVTHKQGSFTPPLPWFVNRSYHWRHHFDNDNAYYCSTFTIFDGLMGTALSLKGKTVAVTGASGTMGRALAQELLAVGAKVIAITSQPTAVSLEGEGEPITLPTRQWQIDHVNALDLSDIDILVINHGVNVYAERSPEAIAHSFAVNTTSALQLMEAFFATVQTDVDVARKEVWVNTSEAEVSPAFSPLYELSKRTLGKLVTLRRLDAPCVVRKIVLGPFKSQLNPVGIMSARWVAKNVVRGAQCDYRNIIVTINPLTYLVLPLHEWFTSLYFRWFSQSEKTPIEIETSA